MRKREWDMDLRNKKDSPVFKSWNVIYPVFIYFVVTNLAMTLFAMLASFLGADYKEQYMALQKATVEAAIPFIANYYNKDRKEPTVFWEHMGLVFGQKETWQKIVNGVLMFLAGALAGMALNNILALTALEEISEGYQETAGYFFAGGIAFELLGACLLTPFLEEMLYRGVVYGRRCDLMILDKEEKAGNGKRQEWISRGIAMALSALLLGVLHRNLVQFAYAGLLGLLLAWLMEKSGHLYGVFLAHMGANLVSVLRVETKLFAWMEQGQPVFVKATAVLVALVAVILAAIQLLNRKKGA